MINTSYIYNNTRRLNNDKKVLDVAMDVASFLDEIGAFAYRNWIHGELVDGPTVKKYFTYIKFMFPENLPPDPEVLRRLKKMKCVISIDKDIYKKVTLVTDDFNNMRYRNTNHTVWSITLEIPNRFLPLDGNTTFNIDGEDVSYDDIEVYYDDNGDGDSSGSNTSDDDFEEGGL